MLYYPLGTPDARLTIAVGEKIGFHDVGALSHQLCRRKQYRLIQSVC